MRLIGYARVSTAEQDLAAQRAALEAAGCAEIVEETASGADPGRPALGRLLARIGRGDTLVVARLDRLARSLAHLLAVIAQLQARGVGFRSLSDPIDTAGPSGTLVLQILGAVAEFERALIRERTRAGLAAARARGRRGGNPGLVARDPAAIARLARAREDARLARALPAAETWLGPVRCLRPTTPWPEVARTVNAGLPPGALTLSVARLKRLARSFVCHGLLDAAVLTPARRRGRAGGRFRAIELAAAAYLRGRPDATLAELGAALLRLGVRPPRGGAAWAPASLKRLRDRGRMVGLTGVPPASSPLPAGRVPRG
ncbi:recombinase family protein [Elioraea sp.]|uniref:recombinase family protein n=1 Tax=Elioraea sp. TaxID=2185103 RepID=UPI003F70D6FF